MENKLEKAVENAKLVGAFGLGCGILVASPFISAGIVFKEEVIDALTGKKQIREKQKKTYELRRTQEDGRVNLRKELYSKWAENSNLELARVFIEKPELMLSYKLYETHPIVGGSFWDFQRYVQTVHEKDGKYFFEKGPDSYKEDYVRYVETDDNAGQSYNLETVANAFAKNITDNAAKSDLITNCYNNIHSEYEHMCKNLKNTKRKQIREFVRKNKT